MNVNEVAAASAYGSMASTAGSPSQLKALGERFAAIFDKADAAAQGFATKNVDAQSVVEALSQAELALQTAITVRDRVVAAYQEILRMPI